MYTVAVHAHSGVCTVVVHTHVVVHMHVAVRMHIAQRMHVVVHPRRGMHACSGVCTFCGVSAPNMIKFSLVLLTRLLDA